MPKHGFVYIWFDKKHKRFYIGSHWGNEKDRYICSSTWMRNAYRNRPNDFKRRILVTNISSRTETIEVETKWLKLIKESELGKRYYNLINKGFSHWSHDELERRRIIQEASIRNKGKRKSPATEIKKGEHRSQATEWQKGRIPHNKGIKLMNEKTRAKLSAAKKGKPSNSPTKFQKGTRLGSDNPRARSIITPFGIFDTITIASQQTGISQAAIKYRLRSNHEHWAYVTK